MVFNHALDRRLDIVFDGVLVLDPLQEVLADHVVHRLERQIGIDGARAVAQQQGKMMHLAGFARLEQQTHPGAGFLANQVMMQARDRQQGGNGRALRTQPAIGKDEDVHSFLDGLVREPIEVLHRPFQAGAAVVHLEEDRQRDRLKVGMFEVAQLGQVLIAQDGGLEFDELAAFRYGFHQVPFRADGGLGRSDQLLAQGVDRRVGHLGKELLEIVIQELGTIGEHRQRLCRCPWNPPARSRLWPWGAMIIRRSS